MLVTPVPSVILSPRKLTVEGPIELIGPDMISLRGGMSGFYVKTTGEKGKAKVTISCPRVEDQTVEFEIN